MIILNEADTALRIAYLADRRKEATGDSRFQLSLKTICELARRPVADSLFITTLASELVPLGWGMFQVTNSSYALIKTDTGSGFRKLSAKALLAFGETKNQQ